MVVGIVANSTSVKFASVKQIFSYFKWIHFDSIRLIHNSYKFTSIRFIDFNSFQIHLKFALHLLPIRFTFASHICFKFVSKWLQNSFNSLIIITVINIVLCIITIIHQEFDWSLAASRTKLNSFRSSLQKKWLRTQEVTQNYEQKIKKNLWISLRWSCRLEPFCAN